MTFIETRPWARAIKTKILSGEMPPWRADPRFGSFSNEQVLTADQIALLVAWIDGGAPEGDGTPPQPPTYQQGWSTDIGRPPDQIFEAPFGHIEIPAQGEIPTFTVWMKPPFKGDRFIQAMQLLPTNRSVVHHASVSVGPPPVGTKLGRSSLWVGGTAVNGVPLSRDGQPYRVTAQSEFGYPLLFYVPGGGLIRFPDGVAKRIRGDEYVSWGMHFVTTGKPEPAAMRLGIWYAKKRPTHEAILMTANETLTIGGRELKADRKGNELIPNIPPYVDNWEITGQIAFQDDVTLYSLWPHMHLRGKDMSFILVYPDRHQALLLKVSNYNMFWQTTYELRQPLHIPHGSILKAVAHYDNSAQNRLNPDPSQSVLWGEQSWNEMFRPYIEVSVDKDDLRFEELANDIIH